MAGWRLAVPVLKWRLPLPRLARLMWTPSRREQRDRPREERIVTLSEALCGPHGDSVLDNCLERSLVSYRFLSQAGAEPELAFGVARDRDDPVPGHAWVRLDGEPVHDTPFALERFEELGAFGAGGVLSPTGGPAGAPAPTPPLQGRSP
jgi:transglutaminase superfamily protein